MTLSKKTIVADKRKLIEQVNDEYLVIESEHFTNNQSPLDLGNFMLTSHTQIEGLDLIDFLSYKDHVYLRARNFRGETLTVPSIIMLLDQTSLKVEAVDEHLAIHCLE